MTSARKIACLKPMFMPIVLSRSTIQARVPKGHSLESPATKRGFNIALIDAAHGTDEGSELEVGVEDEVGPHRDK